MIDDSKEYIICAAVWYRNGKTYPFQSVYGIDNGFVIGSFRHPMCMSVCPENPYFQHKLVENGDETLRFEWNPECKGETVQGFITSYGRFVDRREAFTLALASGQVTRESIRLTQGVNIDEYDKPLSLFSEDIFQKQWYFGSTDGSVRTVMDLFGEKRAEGPDPEEGRSAKVRISKDVRYCSDCPYSYPSYTGYGKSGSYETDICCRADGFFDRKPVHSNLLWARIHASHIGSEWTGLPDALDKVPEDCPLLSGNVKDKNEK